MELSKQCCTVSQGKRLTELGVNAPSLFTYVDSVNGHDIILSKYMLGRVAGRDYPAYTVAELGAMLKPVMEGEVSGTNLIVSIVSQKHGGKPSLAVNPLFLADCLIHLLESKLITPEQCNENLNK
jgi:hypothetical protein